MFDQVHQQVEGAFKLAQFYLISHGFLLSPETLATGASRLALTDKLYHSSFFKERKKDTKHEV